MQTVTQSGMITSSQNAKIKLIRALAGRPKERREADAFLAEGVRLVEDALTAQWPFHFVLFSAEVSARGQDLIAELRTAGVEVEEVQPELLRSASDTATSQGIIAVMKLSHTPQPLPEGPDFLLIPDQIRDPGNLGTLIRTAAATGVQAMIIPPETTDPFAPKVVRAGMGAHFRLPILSRDWTEIGKLTEGMSMVLAEATAPMSCWEADLIGPTCLIVGGEAEGAGAAARAAANVSVCLPMTNDTESLNAGAAGAVLMFEVVRQRFAEFKRPTGP